MEERKITMTFKLTIPEQGPVLTEFQEKYIQAVMDVKIKNPKNIRNESMELLVVTKNDNEKESYVTDISGLEVINNSNLKYAHAAFKESLETNPIYTERIMAKLRKDLGEKFTVKKFYRGHPTKAFIKILWR